MPDLTVFVPDLGGGGAERVLATLANGFAKEGRRVDLACLHADGPVAALVHSTVNVVELKCRMRSALPRLVAYLRRSRPSSLLIGYDHHCVIPILAAHLSGMPMRVCATVHINLGTYLSNDGYGSGIKRIIAGHVLPLADFVVAVSEGVAQDLLTWSVQMRRRLLVVPNPVLSPDILRRATESAGHPWLDSRECPVILGVGRLTSQKDWPTLIEAFAMIRAQRTVRLVILGEGPEQKNLQAVIARLDMDADVSLAGWTNNPYAYMARADILAHSAVYEGCPTVLIEALGVGTPVVATDCPSGPREILEEGKWGQLVRMRDPMALAQAIIMTLDDVTTSHAAVDSVWARYSVDASMAAYRRILFSARPLE